MAMKAMTMMKASGVSERVTSLPLTHVAICPLDYKEAGLIIDDESKCSHMLAVRA